jgi:hypothetical protein
MRASLRMLGAGRGAARRLVRVAHARCVQAAASDVSAPASLAGADAQRLVRSRAAALCTAATPLPVAVQAKVQRAINGCVRCAGRQRVHARAPDCPCPCCRLMAAVRRRYLELESPNRRSTPALLKALHALVAEAEAADADAKAACQQLRSLLYAVADATGAEAVAPQVPVAARAAAVAAPPRAVLEPAAAAPAASPTPAALVPNAPAPAALKPMSEEQRVIVDAALRGTHNLLVNAVAGSGKTTTILHIATQLGDAPALALTYNARLKDETRRKRDALGLRNLDVHSFHAMGVKHYSDACRRDSGLQAVVDAPSCRPKVPLRYELIIVDEAQDLTPLLYAFVCKVMRDNHAGRAAPCRLLLMGDERQTIFQFKEADARYLLRAPAVFDGVAAALPWQTLKLSTTFRMTGNMVTFLNTNVLGWPLFATPNPPGRSKVVYLKGESYNIASLALARELIRLVETGRARAEDIFLLAPSVRQGKASDPKPYNVLENALVKAGIVCYSPTSDDESLDSKEDVMAGKVVISTFHQVKGLERKVVVVFDFSAQYFKFSARDATPVERQVCPNPIYMGACNTHSRRCMHWCRVATLVARSSQCASARLLPAITRATERLYLVGEGTTGGAFSFLRHMRSGDHLNVVTCGKLEKGADDLGSMPSKPSVTRLTKYLTEREMSAAMRFVRTVTLREPYQDVAVPLRVKTARGLSEEVSELNGLAVPALFEAQSTGRTSSMQEQCMAELPRVGTYSLEASKRLTSISEYLRLAAIYGYVTGGFLSKPEQITCYDWLTPEMCEPMLAVLREHLGGSTAATQFEVPLLLPPSNAGLPVEVAGRLDALTDDAIFELKCTREISDEHLLQLVLYGWMWDNLPSTVASSDTRDKGRERKQPCADTHGERRLLVVNVRTGEARELVSTPAERAHVARVLVQAYLRGDPKLDDATFLQNCAAKRQPFLRAPG